MHLIFIQESFYEWHHEILTAYEHLELINPSVENRTITMQHPIGRQGRVMMAENPGAICTWN